MIQPYIQVRRVVPKTYDESMKHVERRRRQQAGLKLRGLYDETSERIRISSKMLSYSKNKRQMIKKH